MYDSDPAEEIKEYFPLTISMVGYFGDSQYTVMEWVNGLDLDIE